MMNRLASLCVAGCLVLLLSAQSAAASDAHHALAGTWEGTLDAGVALRLVLHIRVDGDTLSGVVDSPDQGATGIPVDDLTFTGQKLSFSIKAIGATYRATLKDDTLRGRWRQRGGALGLHLSRVDQPTQVQRPQTPKPPFPYANIPVSFESHDGNAVLDGTLSLPGGGPHTAVILVSGSGPQDRDGTVFGHQPFAVMADYLARENIAVLRFDDRGVGRSTGDRAQATVDDFAADVRGAVTWLAQRDDVRQIGIVGHSEGALVADIVAMEMSQIDWTIRLAGPAVAGRDVLLAQTQAIFRLGGGDDTLLTTLVDINATLYDMAASDLSADALHAKASTFIKQTQRDLDPKTRRALGLPDDVTSMIQVLSTPWFRHFMRHDPQALMAQLEIPVLCVYGGKDAQVLAEQNAPVARKTLRHARSDTRVYPRLNHLLQTAPTGNPSEYATLVETVNPQLLDDLATWIHSLAASDK